MSLIEQCKGEKIRTRNISVAIYTLDEESIAVEGVLKDDRFVTQYTFDGDEFPPGIVHHMVVRMRIRGESLTMEEIEVEMPCTPYYPCVENKNSLNKLKGSSIIQGFASRIKKNVGGINGCVHLTALLLSMVPAAIQGYWANLTRKPEMEIVFPEALIQFLIDSCSVWQRDRTLAKELINEIEGKTASRIGS